MTCAICQRSLTDTNCRRCYKRVATALAELPDLQHEAGFYLEPSRSGTGSATAERSIGINVLSLDFHLAHDLLATLHSWESLIRKERDLTPPALVSKKDSIAAEVDATCAFHLAHLEYALTQPWASDFVSEVMAIHAKGRVAARKFKEQLRRIPCPTDGCPKFVVIDVENLTTDVSCFGCRQSWNVLRLVALAMSNPNRRFFLDVEAIALWLQMTQREVYRLIRKHHVEKRGQMYDLTAIMKIRSAS